MPLNIALVDEVKTCDLNQNDVDRFIEAFLDDRGLRICTRDIVKDQTKIKDMANYASRDKVIDRNRLKRLKRQIETGFQTRVLLAKDLSSSDWAKCCDVAIFFDLESQNDQNPWNATELSERLTHLRNFFDHSSWRSHKDFGNETLYLNPELVKKCLTSALQKQRIVEIFDHYFLRWLVDQDDYNPEALYLSSLSLKFICEIWRSNMVVQPKQREIHIYSVRKNGSDYSEEKVKKRISTFTRDLGLDAEVKIFMYRRGSLEVEEKDRFIKFGQWVFQLIHGIDYLAFVADEVQLKGIPDEYDHDGKNKKKGHLNLIGPRQEYTNRAEAIIGSITEAPCSDYHVGEKNT